MQLLKQALFDAESSHDALQKEVTALSTKVEELSQCCKELWNLNCAQLTEFDAILAAKDEQTATLCQQSISLTPVVVHTGQAVQPVTAHHRKGKAPPVDPLSGDDPSL